MIKRQMKRTGRRRVFVCSAISMAWLKAAHALGRGMDAGDPTKKPEQFPVQAS
jgi:hypothetical protein